MSYPSDNAGLYWYWPPSFDHCRDAWGLYPASGMAQLLPTIEEGECALDDTDEFFGLWNFDPAAWPATETDWPIVDIDVPATGREAIRMFDRARCVEDSATVEPGATVRRLYELARALTTENALGVLENVETSAEFTSTADGRAAVFQNAGSINDLALPVATVILDPRVCPWPSLALGTVRVQVTYHLRVTGVSSIVGPFPPNIFGASPARLPPDAHLGPGDWSDQRYAYGLPRYGAHQWLMRGPSIVRLFATVEVTSTIQDEARDVSWSVFGRLTGYTQQSGSRIANVVNTIRRAP